MYIAKNKNIELERKQTYLNNTIIRKNRRKSKRADNKRVRKSMRGCQGCGEDPYCYCGDGTPYSY